MQIVEYQPHRVIADRMHLHNLHIALAGDDAALGGRMALHLGAWTADAQVFGRQFEAFTVVELDRESFAVLVQAQFRRPGTAHR